MVAAILLGLLTAVPGGPLGTAAAYAAAPDGRLVVTWRDEAPDSLADDGVAAMKRSALNERRSVVIARSGEAAAVAARLKADARVESVVPDAVGSVAEWPLASSAPNDALYATNQADLRLIGMPTAWPMTTGASSVVVAVLDTGYEGTHEDLATIPTVSPYNSRTGSKNVTDGYGHGTHVAGTIAAATNNTLGVAGIAPGVTIMPVKVLDASGQGYWSDFLEGVDWARTHGADVINLSLGSGLSSAQVAAFQPTFTAAYDAGVLVVAAAGNNNNSSNFYPASFAKVVSVSATTNTNTKASFSNYGPKVDLSAPGVSISSTFRDNTYRAMSGTSMATPHVAGLAALIRSLHPAYSPAQVESVMKQTALDLGAAGRDDVFGYGRIRAPESLALDITPPRVSMATPVSGGTNVPESASPVVAFSEAVVGVDGTTVALVNAAGQPVAATVTFDPETNRATVDPAALLASRSTYRIDVFGPVQDLAGLALVATSFSFTTGDTIRPTVIDTHPANGATGVARGVVIRVTFSEKVKGISELTVRLRRESNGERVVVNVDYDKATRTATIEPITRLPGGRLYRLKLLGAIEDVAGLNLTETSFTFRTRD
jgi:subtilisin family serine protease